MYGNNMVTNLASRLQDINKMCSYLLKHAIHISAIFAY